MRIKESITENYKTTYYYDDNERHIRTTDYSDNGEMIWDIHYYYNNLNQCDSWRVLDSKGKVINRFEVDFDEVGREKEVRQFNKQNNLEMRTVNNYDENGFLISEIQFDENGNQIKPEDF